MTKLYRIDPKRIYVAGLSGGGRVASHTAFHHSDVYSGGIFIIGADFWKPASVPEQKVRWKATSLKPRPEYLLRAKEKGRYVLLTGDKDSNRLQMQTYYEGYRKDIDHVLYIQVPGVGHETPPSKAFDEALDYVDTPVSQEAKSQKSQIP
jgi:predicted esterase